MLSCETLPLRLTDTKLVGVGWSDGADYHHFTPLPGEGKTSALYLDLVANGLGESGVDINTTPNFYISFYCFNFWLYYLPVSLFFPCLICPEICLFSFQISTSWIR